MATKKGQRRRTGRPRAVIVHGLAEARAACAVARQLGVAVELRSAPGAAASLGPLWFQEIVRAIEAEFPDLAVDAVLDCADAPGYALAALRQGLKRIRFTGSPATRGKIAAIARRSGATVETGRPPPALDPAREPDAEAALRAWFGRKRP